MVTFDPTVVNGVVYVGITGLNGGYPSDRFFAINATNGESLWNLTSTVDVRGSPVFYNGFVYVDYDDSWHTLHAINVTTGADVWSIPLGISAGPIVAEGILYAGLGNSTFLALNATDGEIIWEANYVDSPEWTHCPAIWNNTIFVSTYEGDMDALNASNGEILWNFTTDERWGTNGASDSPAVAGGVLYFGTMPGWVYALNATTGAQIWRWETPRFGDNGMCICSSPAVDNGVLYIASFYGCLYAFTNAPPPTPTPNPQPTTTATSKPTQTTTPIVNPKPTSTPTPTPVATAIITPTTQPPQTHPSTHPENNQITTIALIVTITGAIICGGMLLIKRKN
jgi:outer membrane protein assembly factor BamB